MQTTQVADAATQVNAVVDHLAAKMAVPASQLWGVLVREARIEGVLDACVSALFLTLSVSAGVFARYAWKRATNDTRYDSPWDVLFWAGVVVCVFAVGIGIINAYVSVTEIANPAYHAATTILNALKSK